MPCFLLGFGERFITQAGLLHRLLVGDGQPLRPRFASASAALGPLHGAIGLFVECLRCRCQVGNALLHL